VTRGGTLPSSGHPYYRTVVPYPQTAANNFDIPQCTLPELDLGHQSLDVRK
jgi:hypothetical protein